MGGPWHGMAHVRTRISVSVHARRETSRAGLVLVGGFCSSLFMYNV